MSKLGTVKVIYLDQEKKKSAGGREKRFDDIS